MLLCENLVWNLENGAKLRFRNGQTRLQSTHRKTHGTCNELHIRLKCLHRLVQLSCLFLVGGRQYLCLMITGELRVPWEERGDCRFEASSTCRIMPPA